ncbi:MAG: LacI family DNA-binding transcriptional regulator [Lentisphaeria bacterium]|nr:LacI family DNA-binding transcriptional regulator [Lentisphaeria bacterium]
MIRMVDIAKKAGVSRTTVSFVLNGRYKQDMKISEPIVRLVLETAEEMGYVKDENANAIVTGKSRVIAIISAFDDYMMPTVRGCMEEAQEHGCMLKLISLKDGINEAIRKAIAFRVGGIYAIIRSQLQKQIDPKYLQLEIPSIGLKLHTGKMAFNQIESAKLGTEYLIQKGHRKILFWGLHEEIAKERELGYVQVMEKYGLKPEIAYSSRQNGSWNIDMLDDILKNRKPDAIQCFSDLLAFKIMRECYKRKIFIPDTFSLMGFGHTPASRECAPLLATIDEPYFETGKIMFHQIYELMEHGTYKAYTPLIGTLIPGETVAEK